jgi:hypothetical protein
MSMSATSIKIFIYAKAARWRGLGDKAAGSVEN